MDDFEEEKKFEESVPQLRNIFRVEVDQDRL